MNLLELIYNKPELVINDSTSNLMGVNLPHYNKFRKEDIEKNFSNLLLAFTKCIENNSADEMISYMDLILNERFAKGFQIEEVEIALNIFEESIWKNIYKNVDEDKQYSAMKLALCILSKAKEELLNDYAMMSKC